MGGKDNLLQQQYDTSKYFIWGCFPLFASITLLPLRIGLKLLSFPLPEDEAGLKQLGKRDEFPSGFRN